MVHPNFEFAAATMYIIIGIFSIIGTILYVHAYICMKHSKIIGSIAMMLSCIAIDALWWGYVEFSRMKIGEYPEWMICALSLFIIKLILAIGVIHFVVISVKSDGKVINLKNCKKKGGLNGKNRKK